MLDLLLLLTLLVLRDLGVLLPPFEHLNTVPAHVADRNARLLGVFCRYPRQLAPSLLIQIGDRNADRLTLSLRIEAEPSFSDRLVDGLDNGAVPDLDGDHPRLRHADIGDLIERRRTAVSGDGDRFEQTRRGAAGSQPSEFLAQHFESAVHAAPEILEEHVFRHGLSFLGMLSLVDR